MDHVVVTFKVHDSQHETAAHSYRLTSYGEIDAVP